jgi:hypothetical protein
MNPFRVETKFLIVHPGLSLRSNPGFELANALGVYTERALPLPESARLSDANI